jgi:alcohol dehydrogenase
VKAAKKAGADVFVSVGGGSPIDSARAMALCLAEGLTEACQLDNYMVKFQYPDKVEIPSMRREAIPHISISTTLSMAEFTNIAGITDEERKVKDLYIDNNLMVKVAILDPEMTVTTPAWLWGSTGIRSMDHAVESICSISHMPLNDALSLAAISMLFEHLPTSTEDPKDIAARGQCQIAGWMSIFGITNVMVGLSHGIGHQLGAICNAPHGVTSCLMLPHIMEFNRPVTADRQAIIAKAMGIDTRGMTDEEAATKAADTLYNFIKDLKVSQRLRDWGVQEANFEVIADSAMQDMVVAGNPRPVRREDIIELLRKAW